MSDWDNEHIEPDTNVGLGMVPHKKSCRCLECKYDRLIVENKRLKELVRTYKEMPFPCHDYMSKEEWEDICYLCAE